MRNPRARNMQRASENHYPYVSKAMAWPIRSKLPRDRRQPCACCSSILTIVQSARRNIPPMCYVNFASDDQNIPIEAYTNLQCIVILYTSCSRVESRWMEIVCVIATSIIDPTSLYHFKFHHLERTPALTSDISFSRTDWQIIGRNLREICILCLKLKRCIDQPFPHTWLT